MSRSFRKAFMLRSSQRGSLKIANPREILRNKNRKEIIV